MEPNGALYTAAAAVLVAFITTAGTVLTARSAQRRANNTPALEPAAAAGSTAAPAPHGPTFLERELAYAQQELLEERQEKDGLRQLLRIALGYIRTLLAHIRQHPECGPAPEPPAALDLDVP